VQPIFVLGGLVLGLLVGGFMEFQRRRRRRFRQQYLRDGLAATARVQAVWEHGRHGKQRGVIVRYVDAGGKAHEGETLLSVSEFDAAGIRVGAQVRVRYLPFQPGVIVIERPDEIDDRIVVPLLSALTVCVVVISAGVVILRK
jgi:hypothetical protein